MTEMKYKDKAEKWLGPLGAHKLHAGVRAIIWRTGEQGWLYFAYNVYKYVNSRF